MLMLRLILRMHHMKLIEMLTSYLDSHRVAVNQMKNCLGKKKENIEEQKDIMYR